MGNHDTSSARAIAERLRRKGQFDLDAVVLQRGHVDPITGPRCMIQMREGPDYGLYFIGHSETVLEQGTPVIYDTITRRLRTILTEQSHD